MSASEMYKKETIEKIVHEAVAKQLAYINDPEFSKRTQIIMGRLLKEVEEDIIAKL